LNQHNSSTSITSVISTNVQHHLQLRYTIVVASKFNFQLTLDQWLQDNSWTNQFIVIRLTVSHYGQPMDWTNRTTNAG